MAAVRGIVTRDEDRAGRSGAAWGSSMEQGRDMEHGTCRGVVRPDAGTIHGATSVCTEVAEAAEVGQRSRLKLEKSHEHHLGVSNGWPSRASPRAKLQQHSWGRDGDIVSYLERRLNMLAGGCERFDSGFLPSLERAARSATVSYRDSSRLLLYATAAISKNGVTTTSRKQRGLAAERRASTRSEPRTWRWTCSCSSSMPWRR